jgi:hypothetical protein
LYVDADEVLHGFVRSAAGSFRKVDAPGASTFGMVAGTAAFSINDAGVVAGTYIDSNTALHGFVYTPGSLAATTTTLTSSHDPSVYREPVTLTAKVASGSSAPKNGESVSFMIGAKLLGAEKLTGGTATLTTTDLPVGADSVTAVYGGDTDFSSSTSKALIQTVGRAKSTTTLTVKPNPSAYLQPVTFTASVSGQFGGTLTGTVDFYSINPLNNAMLKLGSATLSKGMANFTIDTLPLGVGTIESGYSGDSNFESSLSESVHQTVSKAPTTIELVSSPNPSKFGEEVTFTATVAGQFGGTPSASVTFFNGTTALKSIAPSNRVAKFTTAALPPGANSIAAAYAGGADFDSSKSKAVGQLVDKAATTVSLTSSPNPAKTGETIIFKATVKAQYAGTPAGSVTFKDGTTVLKTVTLSGGEAKLASSTLAAGEHSITAVYSGSTDFDGGSASLTQKVN